MNKKIFLFAIFLIAILIIGCTQQVSTGVEVIKKEDTGGTTTSEQRTVSYVLSSSEKKLAEDKLTTSNYIAVSKTNFGADALSIGDVYVFGIGVLNIKPTEEEFFIEARFIEAKDQVSSAIETDKNVMESWLAKNNFGQTYKLETQKQTVIPLIIEVGNKRKSDMETIPGTYVFEVEVKTKNDVFSDDYGWKPRIYVKVK